jgi:hypothetical protein
VPLHERYDHLRSITSLISGRIFARTFCQEEERTCRERRKRNLAEWVCAWRGVPNPSRSNEWVDVMSTAAFPRSVLVMGWPSLHDAVQ